MAQLRCAQTSELLAQGTPLEIATAAEAFPAGEVLFDDVGKGFDPAALRKARADEITGLERALADLPASPKADERARIDAMRDSLRATLAERKDRIAAGKALVAPAQERLTEARRRRDERSRAA